jgi:PQQ-dependent dehydrogenase (s-GDH family)
VRWAPNGQLWITERTKADILQVDPDTGSTTVLLRIPDAYQSEGQDGVLGLAMDPGLLKTPGRDFAYVVLTIDADPGPDVRRRMVLRRYRFDRVANQLIDPSDLVADLPAGDDHVGGRLAFGPDEKLYLTIGDQAANHSFNFCTPNRAQDLPTAADVSARNWSLYQGKILRINLDGSIPADNPLLAGVRSHIFSYGHRTPQGLAFAPDGTLYESEHGPATDDEINVIQAGKNYGWPYVAGFQDDRGYAYANWSASSPTPCRALTYDEVIAPPSVPIQKESAWHSPDFQPPIQTFFTVASDYAFKALGNATIAPSGITLYSATAPTAVPQWANSVLVTSLKMGSVFRLKLRRDGRAVVTPVNEYFKAGGRYRDVAVSPDGGTVFVAVDFHASVAHAGDILAFRYVGNSTQ